MSSMAVPVDLQHGAYQTSVSCETTQPEWDEFLLAADAAYPQSSMWAQIKAGSGYRAQRLLVRQDGNLVGGAQFLIRSLPIGAYGYIPLGPVLQLQDPALAALVVGQICTIAAKERLHFLAIQPPPSTSGTVLQVLREAGFTTPFAELAPTATVQIDLSRDADQLFSTISATTRKHIRRAERTGITVREGTASDLARFHELLCVVAARRGFHPPGPEYFADVWRALAPQGHIKLFAAEFEGEMLAALLVIAFGDTVTCWRVGWSGRRQGIYPNETMHWAAIRWAQSKGYRYFDFGGVDRAVIESLVAGKPLAEEPGVTRYNFKLSFGGEPKLFPQARGYIRNPVIRWASTRLPATLLTGGNLKKMIFDKFR